MPRSTGRQPRMRGLKPTLSGVGRTLATILVVLILALVAEHICQAAGSGGTRVCGGAHRLGVPTGVRLALP